MTRPATLQDARAEKARRSLAAFVRQAWPVIEPSTNLVWNWHIDVICDRVQALLEGRLPTRNLVVNVPPGSLKSTILSVCLPAWMWINNPSWRGLFASGNESIALRDSMKCRYILDSDWYKRLFRPEWQFASDQNAKGHYVNTKRGFRHAISAGSRITGDRADDMFIDDTGHRCIIQQRLHEEDLTGHILATDAQDWEHLVIRQEFELGDEQPWDPRTTEGELFFPARFPTEVVAAEKRIKGSAGYAGQHQQRPTAKEGEIFKRGYVKFFKGVPRFTRTLLSADTAFKEKEESDYSVILAAGVCEEEGHAGIYLLDRWKEQAGYPVLKTKARTMGDRWHPEVFLIEDKASGQSLIQELTNDTLLPVRAVKADTDKVSRANTCTPTWEASIIYLPEGAEWVDDFLENLYGFPKKAHDDDVDAFTQLVRYIVLGMTAQGFLGWLAGKQKEEPCASSPTKQPFLIQL